jgi:hypothetical protein
VHPAMAGELMIPLSSISKIKDMVTTESGKTKIDPN